MAVVTFKTFSMPMAAQVMDAVRGVLRRGPRDVAVEEDAPAAADISDYEQILKRELGQADAGELVDDNWTALEREDTEMLARVREALYADD